MGLRSLSHLWWWMFAILAAPLARAEDSPVASLTEILLPAYKQAALNRDLPARDLAIGEDHVLTVLGSTGLWRWSIAERSLQRMQLLSTSDRATLAPLQYLGSDGTSQFATSDDQLYQVVWSPRRVLRYALKGPGTSLGFVGGGDDYWLLRTNALLKFDRYGKTLVPYRQLPGLSKDDPVVYDISQHRLWYAHKTKLFYLDLKNRAAAPVTALRVKHQLLGLQSTAHELVAHTRYSVLRMTRAGKVIRAIPVEGHRKLLTMAISEDAHAYLFDDQLVEIYFAASHAAQRYRMPLDDGEQPTQIRLQGSYLAVLVAGRPRLFHLDMTNQRH